MYFTNYQHIISQGEKRHSLLSHKLFAVTLHNNFVKYGVPNCEHPIFLKSRAQYVPCGHCALCASRVKKDWIVRCNLELQKYNCGEFITLTFDDMHLFDTSYAVVQKFLKRLRKGINKDIKYFVAYENGDRTGRPHYHILIFGFHRPYPVDPKFWNSYLADRYWKNGIVKAVPMTSANIPYVCGYVQKKLSSEFQIPQGLSRREFNRYNLHSLNDIELSLSCKQSIHRQEFVKMSKGLGFSWCNNLKKVKQVLKRGCFLFGKFRYAIPRALLLRLQALGLDWLIMPEFSKFLEVRDLMGKNDVYSYEYNYGLTPQPHREGEGSAPLANDPPPSDELKAFAYLEPSLYIDSVLQFMSYRNKVFRQKALNIVKSKT